MLGFIPCCVSLNTFPHAVLKHTKNLVCEDATKSCSLAVMEVAIILVMVLGLKRIVIFVFEYSVMTTNRIFEYSLLVICMYQA